ncbi:hypothetical protein BD626DRAFT_535199 [Schizophyllum amplum]|uniref:Uncharacterized protein n=1 Tax=Schizophyllum amplum TaxID=97359 RepID=A0A550CR82_9AGAR|nr:hypothetical protein BD626DRAFT_535199 [Auriculariopsis ampla]
MMDSEGSAAAGTEAGAATPDEGEERIGGLEVSERARAVEAVRPGTPAVRARRPRALGPGTGSSLGISASLTTKKMPPKAAKKNVQQGDEVKSNGPTGNSSKTPGQPEPPPPRKKKKVVHVGELPEQSASGSVGASQAIDVVDQVEAFRKKFGPKAAAAGPDTATFGRELPSVWKDLEPLGGQNAECATLLSLKAQESYLKFQEIVLRTSPDFRRAQHAEEKALKKQSIGQ